MEFRKLALPLPSRELEEQTSTHPDNRDTDFHSLPKKVSRLDCRSIRNPRRFRLCAGGEKISFVCTTRRCSQRASGGVWILGRSIHPPKANKQDELSAAHKVTISSSKQRVTAEISSFLHFSTAQPAGFHEFSPTGAVFIYSPPPCTKSLDISQLERNMFGSTPSSCSIRRSELAYPGKSRNSGL